MTEAHSAADQTRLVEQLFALTGEIEQATRIADWQRAAMLTEERAHLQQSISAEQSPDALALIRRIQEMDAVTLREATLAQSELATEFRAATERNHAARRYTDMALMR